MSCSDTAALHPDSGGSICGTGARHNPCLQNAACAGFCAVISLAEVSVLLANTAFGYSQPHIRWACTDAVLYPVPHRFRDLCATCLEGALECPLMQHTEASWSQDTLWGFFKVQLQE